MVRRPPRSAPLYASAASDVYKRQPLGRGERNWVRLIAVLFTWRGSVEFLSLIHISEPTRLRRISYAVFRLKKKNLQFQPLTNLLKLLHISSYNYMKFNK